MTLADLSGMDRDALISHACESFEVDRAQVDRFEFVVAHESVGSWGCDSSATWVLRDAHGWYVVSGSHCSCHGFEGQWMPHVVTLPYLLSEHFDICKGGYGPDVDMDAVRSHIRLAAAGGA